MCQAFWWRSKDDWCQVLLDSFEINSLNKEFCLTKGTLQNTFKKLYNVGTPKTFNGFVSDCLHYNINISRDSSYFVHKTLAGKWCYLSCALLGGPSGYRSLLRWIQDIIFRFVCDFVFIVWRCDQGNKNISTENLFGTWRKNCHWWYMYLEMPVKY